ncbi:anti-sigma T factor NepR [Brevundimonas sp.]|uniref:anti-sigma T factor NepR n=1 Tax=Brevundimonas sp. TaxID=1871086 RepID=UPI002FCC05B7
MTEKSQRVQNTSDIDDVDLDEARLRQQAIGVKLRHLFDEIVNEPVPDEFLSILRRADQRENKGGA